MHQSFLNFRNYRYAFAAAWVSAAALLAYAVDRPRVPANGGTWLGYTLGSLAALLVIFLALFGVRKRSFHSSLGTALEWLSAHVYLGLAALLLATLHSGMHFGLNVHTLAYVLMCFVTLSGCWGVYAYARYPGAMTQQRGNTRRKDLLREIAEIDRQSLDLAARVGPQVVHLVADATRRTHLGAGSLWKQLRGRDESTLLAGVGSALRPARLVNNEAQSALIQALAELLPVRSNDSTLSHVQRLLELAGSKAVVGQRLRGEMRLSALLRIWLYVHVPLCCAMLSALCIHVFTVFLYW